MVYAAVLAGGSGLRMGGSLPKQFLEVAGRPIIIRSIQAFIGSGSVDKIFVAVSADFSDYTSELIAKYLGDAAVTVVTGGKNGVTLSVNSLTLLNSCTVSTGFIKK